MLFAPLSACLPVCPLHTHQQNRHGFVRGAEKSQWAGLHHTKVEMLVTRFDSGAMEFVRKEMNPFLGPEGRWVLQRGCQGS